MLRMEQWCIPRHTAKTNQNNIYQKKYTHDVYRRYTMLNALMPIYQESSPLLSHIAVKLTVLLDAPPPAIVIVPEISPMVFAL